jgi:hypothetical protein
MQECPHCGKPNPENEAYCYSCGHILPAGLAGSLNATTRLEEVYESLEPKRRWGTAYFDRRSQLQLSFRGFDETLLVEVPELVVFGRFHHEPNAPQPDIDLTPYGAIDKGVSRRHLQLTRDHDTIFVSDLGSANHTYLNGQRLLPHEPRILRDNDELRLGHLVLRVNFV